MTFAIITHVPHILEQNQCFAYAPYVREMNVWAKYANKLLIVAPKSNSLKTSIDISYEKLNIEFIAIKSFDVLSVKAIVKAIISIPKISWQIFSAMRKADHIHLRCPGNIGLLGSMVQILFPNKPKTAKYAGNWDPKSKQPLTYRLQKWILSSTFLTRNMQVLVYGEWEGSSKNIKRFFTATYQEADKLPIMQRDFKSQIGFVFVGALVSGKQPLYAIRLVEMLYKKGYNVALELYGEGIERKSLEDYISKNNLDNIVWLKGNQTQETVKKAYESSHFVILPSESEGWPKSIAEGMFWGCVPVATKVSCVPFMLDYGDRGVLIAVDLEKDVRQLETLLKDEILFKNMSQKASDWSRYYTLDVFEKEIKKLLAR
ncbi:glycosyltransferase family 4 protein [Flavobacterium franklandianum]|uniref:glycosyltransferase family 4 protein n=1 Tax=Flavobacterium franklandianum TaxID=2594430 RepID=UPI0011798EC6|nr:glycosyltransferase family 4 protein [Flavobacterium franklandianum]TRX26725.1 glycosyltransferase family 4 protein [Flavobacterium franklandianum]